MALHLDGWSVKVIASYLKVSRKTVYRVIGRWLEEGEEGLQDRPPGRPEGVRKVNLATMNDIRRMQENPELGAFRIHAALAVQHAGETLSRYEIEYKPGSRGQATKLVQVRRPELFETSFTTPQMRLFGLEETLGEGGWLKAMKLEGYATRRIARPQALQEVLFSYLEALC